MICKECPYKREYRRYGNTTADVWCKHPDNDFIVEYFKKHHISKAFGFIGFVNSKGVFPIKKSPKWCPLKKETAAVKIATTTETEGD